MVHCKVKLWMCTAVEKGSKVHEDPIVYQKVKKNMMGKTEQSRQKNMAELRSEQKEMLTFHLLSSTWFYHSAHVVLFGSVSLSLPPSSFIFSLTPPAIHLGFCFSSLILTHFVSPAPHSPPHPLPCYHLSAIHPSLSSTPPFSLTSCSPVCQTVIINGENDSPPGPWEPCTLAALSVCVSPYLQTWPIVPLYSMRLYAHCQWQKHDLTPSKKHSK